MVQSTWPYAATEVQSCLDLQERRAGDEWGRLVGAARLGERASIGYGTWMSAHGGAVESLLDEATAELAKMEWAPMLSTIEVWLSPPSFLNKLRSRLADAWYQCFRKPVPQT